MKAEDIRQRLAELALDTNEYRINAGGAMVLHGLREETHDLDIWCTKKLGDTLAPIAPEEIAACTELYNYYIENTCITLEEEPVTPEEFGARVARIMKDYPYIVARNGAGKPIGFAYLDVFNPRSAYRCTADLSIYVDRACRGSGVGQKLYAEIEQLGRERGIENLISIITSDNEGSLRFHRKNGFTEIGVMPAVAFKFGKYLDVSFFQKHLG